LVGRRPPPPRGAVAGATDGKSDPAKLYIVDDAPPTLELREDAHSLTVGVPIDLFALYGDLDDPLDNLDFTWQVVAPVTQPPIVLDPVITTSDVSHKLAQSRLVPTANGTWDIKATVTVRGDPASATERHLTFDVLPDRPPCLVQSRPILPPPGAALPITEPTVFQIAVVDDDLDSYPPLSSDPLFGTTAFAWSILRPGASVRQPLVGATGNAIDFDPAAFSPGDRVELRVEIFDRNHTTIPCADGAATCSIAGDGCLQRQTWQLEAR
jgi:hypothetical protein